MARISTKEQEQGYSINAQRQRLEEYCLRKDLGVIRTFEIIESSTIANRKKFAEMIKFVKKQKSTTAIIVDKVDRLQSNFNEKPVLDELLKKKKIEIHFYTEYYYMHAESRAQDKLRWSQSVVYAQYYVDTISENVNRSIKHKLNSGEIISTAPIGYINVHTPDNKSNVIIDIERAPLIKRLFEEYATGEYTPAELRRKTIEWGLTNSKGKQKHLSKSQIYEIIANPFYYGVLRYKAKNEYYEHVYEPLITKALFERCQAIKLSNKKVRKHKWGTKEYLFSKLIRCAVTGRLVTCDTKTRKYTNGKTASWTYLRVWTSEDATEKKLVREEKVTEQIEQALLEFHHTPEELAKIERDFLEKEELRLKSFKRELNTLKSEYDKINRKLERLSDFLLDGTVDNEYYKPKRAELILEKQNTEARIEKIKADKDQFSKSVLDTIKEASNAYTEFKLGNNAKKREIIEKIFDQLELKDEQLQYVIRYPYDRCAKNNKN